MLDTTFDQASGLSAMKLRPPTRVLPVVHNPSGSASLELLWRLEGAFQSLGLPVAVVEGAHGLTLHDARQGHRAVLSYWLDNVPVGTVVLLHAPLEALAVLLADSQARPLVALNAEPRSLVDAYNATKVLLQVAGLMPVVIQLQDDATPPDSPLRRFSDTLRANCLSHLSTVPAIWSLGYHHRVDGSLDDSDESCALRVLDTALVLEETESHRHVHLPNESRPKPAADTHVGVSDVHRQRHA